MDPPGHSRLRRLVAIPYTPTFIEGLRPRVQTIAARLLDAVEARAVTAGHREMDLIDEFAYPLPLTVIAEMLGFRPPTETGFANGPRRPSRSLPWIRQTRRSPPS